MALRNYLILRRPQSGRLEGRTTIIQFETGIPPGPVDARLPSETQSCGPRESALRRRLVISPGHRWRGVCRRNGGAFWPAAVGRAAAPFGAPDPALAAPNAALGRCRRRGL